MNRYLGLRKKITRAMFCSVVAGEKIDVFSRQKSRRCLPYRPGDKRELKSQDVTAKLVGFNILCMVPFFFVLS